MSVWLLVLLIALAWLSYPVAGAASVSAAIHEGKRDKGSGFSFLPELIVFPAAFLCLAALIDWWAMPWGRMIVGGMCLLMIIAHLVILARSLRRIRLAKRAPPN